MCLKRDDLDDRQAHPHPTRAAKPITHPQSLGCRNQNADADRMRHFELKCRSQYFPGDPDSIASSGAELSKPTAAPQKAAPPQSSHATTPSTNTPPTIQPPTKPSYRIHQSPAPTNRPPARRRATRRPMEDPESLKALAGPIDDLIKDLLDESPVAFEYLRPHLPSSIAPAMRVDTSNDPAHEGLKTLVKAPRQSDQRPPGRGPQRGGILADIPSPAVASHRPSQPPELAHGRALPHKRTRRAQGVSLETRMCSCSEDPKGRNHTARGVSPKIRMSSGSEDPKGRNHTARGVSPENWA